MVEIEIGVMVRQCFDRRIADKATLVSEIAHRERRRSRDRAGLDWMFTVERAHEKLDRAHPAHSGHPAHRPLEVAAGTNQILSGEVLVPRRSEADMFVRPKSEDLDAVQLIKFHCDEVLVVLVAVR